MAGWSRMQPNRLRAGVVLVLWSIIAPAVALAETRITLTVLEWDGYISAFEQDFEAHALENGLSVDLIILPDAIASSDDVFTALRARAADIVTPTHNYFKHRDNQIIGLLAPIDTARLRNYELVKHRLRALDHDSVDEAKYSVPLLGGSYGLAYNAARVVEPRSWEVLWDPAYKGQISITADQFEANVYQILTMMQVPPELIFDVDSDPGFDWTPVQDKLTALVANSGPAWRGMAGDFGDGFDLEGFDALSFSTTYWFGVAAANARGKSWRIARNLVERETIWLDTMAIAAHAHADADKRRAAYLLLDFMISDAIQRRIHALYGSVVVNERVAAEVGQDGFFNDTSLFWRPLSQRTRNFYRLLWGVAVLAAGK